MPALQSCHRKTSLGGQRKYKWRSNHPGESEGFIPHSHKLPYHEILGVSHMPSAALQAFTMQHGICCYESHLCTALEQFVPRPEYTQQLATGSDSQHHQLYCVWQEASASITPESTAFCMHGKRPQSVENDLVFRLIIWKVCQ